MSQVIELTSNIFIYPAGKNDRPVIGLIVGEKSCLLVDAGNSPSHLNEALTQFSKIIPEKPPITYLVITHWHWDHIFGLSHFEKDHFPVIITHNETREKMQELKTYAWDNEALLSRVKNGQEIEFCSENIMLEYPDSSRNIQIQSPSFTFSSSLKINLGNLMVDLQHFETDHSPDSVIIKCNDVMFLGDCFYPDIYHKMEYTLEKLLPVLRYVKQDQITYFVFGHQDPLSQTEFAQYIQLLETIIDSLTQQITNPNQILDNIYSTISEELLLRNDWPKEDLIELIESFLNGLSEKSKEK